MTIQQIQHKLPVSQQDQWAEHFEHIKRKQQRNANFEDFVSWLDFKCSAISNPVYSRHHPVDNKQVSVNNTMIKNQNVVNASKGAGAASHKKTTDVKFASCIVCNEAHDLDSCQVFGSMDLKEK